MTERRATKTLAWEDVIKAAEAGENVFGEWVVERKRKPPPDDNSKIPNCTQELIDRVSANADALIAIGQKEWYRTRRKGKPPKKNKVLEDQLREIEDKLVEDTVERT